MAGMRLSVYLIASLGAYAAGVGAAARSGASGDGRATAL